MLWANITARLNRLIVKRGAVNSRLDTDAGTQRLTPAEESTVLDYRKVRRMESGHTKTSRNGAVEPSQHVDRDRRVPQDSGNPTPCYRRVATAFP